MITKTALGCGLKTPLGHRNKAGLADWPSALRKTPVSVFVKWGNNINPWWKSTIVYIKCLALGTLNKY